MPNCLSSLALVVAAIALAGCSATETSSKPAPGAASGTSMAVEKKIDDAVPEGSSTAELTKRLGTPADIRRYTVDKVPVEVWVYKRAVATEWAPIEDRGQSSGMYAGAANSDPTKIIPSMPAPTGGTGSYTRRRTITYDCVAFTIIDQKIVKIQRFQTQSQKTGYE